MAEEKNEQLEELNDENDAREEDVAEDVDSDTADVTEKEDEIEGSDSAIMGMIRELRDKMDRIEADMGAIRDAQSVMITDARIIDTESDVSDAAEVDNFVPLEELDFTV